MDRFDDIRQWPSCRRPISTSTTLKWWPSIKGQRHPWDLLDPSHSWRHDVVRLPQIISWHLRSNLILINLKLKQWRMWPSPFTHPHYWHMRYISHRNAIIEQAVSNVLLAPRNALWVVMVPLVRVGWVDRLEPTIDATEWTVHQPEPSYDVIRNSDGMVDALEGKPETEDDIEIWVGSVKNLVRFWEPS